MRRAAVLLLVLAATSAAVPAEDPRDVSALLRPIVEARKVPGLVALALGPKGVEALGAAGVRRRGSPQAITPDDPMHLGSCTKAMTATLCALLVDEGTLRWDASPAAVFEDVKPIDAGWRDATLEMLVRNRAGAPPNLDADGLWARLFVHEGTPVEQRRALVEGMLKRAPSPAPGTTTIYSNAGFALAGAMAETKAGTAWEDLLRAKVFGPLGMTSAGFGAPVLSGAADAPRGHRPDGSVVGIGRGSDNPPAIGPAGTVHASLPDWAKFVALHLRRGEGAPGRLAKLDFAKLHTPPEGTDYAMGWVATTRPWAMTTAATPAAESKSDSSARKRGGTVLTHSGSNTMWFCVAWLAPERGFAVLAACNQGGDAAAKACDDAAAALIREHLERAR